MGTERRKNKDSKLLIVHSISMLAWACFILALIVFHYARPEMEYGIIRYFGLDYRDHWLVTPRNLMILFLILTGIMSSISILLRQNRIRRSSDSIGVNQISLLIICIICLLVITF